MNILSTRLFTWRQILTLTAAFVAVVVVIQRSLRYVCANWVEFDCPYYWPVSIFSFRVPGAFDLVVAGAVALAFYFGMRLLEGKEYRLVLTIGLGVLLIAGSTLIHGVEVGYYTPISGDARSSVLIPNSRDGQEYYHDALKIADPADFFRRYNEVQPTLSSHGHTHPPGAVLAFYYLEKVFGDPAMIAIFILFASTIPSVYFVYRLMSTEVNGELAGYMAFLFVLLPAVQIYYLATIDAVVVSLIMGVLYLFCFDERRWAMAGAVVLVAGSFMLTFVTLFIVPVLVGFDLLIRRSLRRSVIVLGSVGLFYVVLYLLTGYNAFLSFRTASHYENPLGFMLFVDPANYFFTRIEDVAEILFFFGPFLLVLFIRGIRRMRFRPLDVLTVLGCISLLGMYVTGAWRTGETARACAFIYPFLLFPIARYLHEQNAGQDERMQLATLVFVQSLAMQTFGNYHW